MYLYLLCLIAVNYRGSAGYGQDGVFSLLGKVGTQDVNDVQVSGISLFPPPPLLSLSLSLSLPSVTHTRSPRLSLAEGVKTLNSQNT